jgi:hypothetical protein
MFAQTNLQLYNQLRQAEYAESDLAVVRRAYELSMRLFTGQFRSTGKPFLAHLVGTASVLAAFGARPAVTTAGLLHAAYASGDFGGGTKLVTTERRQVLREAAGDEVENLVERFTHFPWSCDSITQLRGRLDGLSPTEVDLVFMRLANTLEDYLDLGMSYSRKAQNANQADHYLELTTQIADALGFAQQAAALESAFKEHRGEVVPPALRREDRSSFTLAPLSYGRRPRVVIQRLSRSVSRQARRRAKRVAVVLLGRAVSRKSAADGPHRVGGRRRDPILEHDKCPKPRSTDRVR